MVYVFVNHNVIASCKYMYCRALGQTLFNILRLLPPFVVSIYVAILINNTYSCLLSDVKQYDSNVEIYHSRTVKTNHV